MPVTTGYQVSPLSLVRQGPTWPAISSVFGSVGLTLMALAV